MKTLKFVLEEKVKGGSWYAEVDATPLLNKRRQKISNEDAAIVISASISALEAAILIQKLKPA